jgi:hypothetical protein
MSSICAAVVVRWTDSRVTDLGESYYTHNLPIIQQRLVAAGVRLGALLNSIFSSSRVPPPSQCLFLPTRTMTPHTHTTMCARVALCVRFAQYDTTRHAPCVSHTTQIAKPHVPVAPQNKMIIRQ